MAGVVDRFHSRRAWAAQCGLVALQQTHVDAGCVVAVCCRKRNRPSHYVNVAALLTCYRDGAFRFADASEANAYVRRHGRSIMWCCGAKNLRVIPWDKATEAAYECRA